MHHHNLIVLCLVALSFIPRESQAQSTLSGFTFADVAPNAFGAGGTISRSFGGHLQLGGFIDAYTPYAKPRATEFEAFALAHLSASIFIARLHLGVGSDVDGNWSPRGFVILTTATRIAPWVNVFATIPADNPSTAYVQTRVGVRAGLSSHWLAIAYIEVPLAPTPQLPFVDHKNHLGATLIYTF